MPYFEYLNLLRILLIHHRNRLQLSLLRPIPTLYHSLLLDPLGFEALSAECERGKHCAFAAAGVSEG